MAYQLSDNVKKGCLYLLKHDQEFYSQISAIIKPEYFEFDAYRNIFVAITEYYEKYRNLPTDDAIVDYIKHVIPGGEKDKNDYEDDLIGINQMDKSAFENREFIMDIIEDFAKKSSLKQAIRKSVVLLEDGKIDEIQELIKESMLINRNLSLGQDYFDEVQQRLHRFFVQKNEQRFPTIFAEHNKNLEGGLCRKELAMVVGSPGTGKSLYLVNQGARSLLDGKNVIYISCEMSEDKIANRFDSILTHIKNSKLKEPLAQLKLHERLGKIREKTPGQLIIKEFPTGQANVNQIRSLLVQLELHKGFRPDVLIVDYLELLRPNRTIDAEYMAQQRIAEELRGLASEHNVLTWVATQPNRMARRVPVITDAELGDSYGKIRPVDWAISLNQTQEEYDMGEMRVYVMKARDSKQHYMIKASVDYSTLRIEDIVNDSEERTAVSGA